MYLLILICVVWWVLSAFKPIVIKTNSVFAGGMAIAPFIFIQPYATKEMLEHEQQHIFQQRLLSPPFMLLLYVLNFIINLTWAWYPAIKCEHWRIKWIREIPLSDFFIVRWWWTAYSFIVFEMDAARFWWPSKP